MKCLCTILPLIVFIIQNSHSQEFIEITPTSSTHKEIVRGMRSSFLPTKFQKPAKSQILISKDELENAGLEIGSEIIGIQWYVTKDNTPNTVVYDLYLSDDFTNNALPEKGVFANNLNFKLVGESLTDTGNFTDWHTANFTIPFVWNGTHNIVIQVCRKRHELPWNLRDEILSVSTPNYTSITGFQTNCDDTNADVERSFKHRPKIRFIVNKEITLTNVLIDKYISSLHISPNPSSDFIKIEGLNQTENYAIQNSLGRMVVDGIIEKDEKINIKKLTNGIYFICLKNNTLKFVKQ